MRQFMDIRRGDKRERGWAMDFLVPLAVIGGWIVLQLWVLPYFGVST
jgi:hypothetical protein